MLNYLMNCMSSIESKHKNSGILFVGDFNKLNVANLKSSYRLKQMVKFATRGANTVDLVGSFHVKSSQGCNPTL